MVDGIIIKSEIRRSRGKKPNFSTKPIDGPLRQTGLLSDPT